MGVDRDAAAVVVADLDLDGLSGRRGRAREADPLAARARIERPAARDPDEPARWGEVAEQVDDDVGALLRVDAEVSACREPRDDDVRGRRSNSDVEVRRERTGSVAARPDRDVRVGIRAGRRDVDGPSFVVTNAARIAPGPTLRLEALARIRNRTYP